MKRDRLPVKVYLWERSLKTQGWAKNILEYANMSDSNGIECKSDLDVLQARLKVLNRDKWWVEACSKPKLDTFVQIHDRTEIRGIVKHNLSRPYRSIVSKFKSGVLPLMIEMGRYTDTKREQRICKRCNSNITESEEHFLLDCDGRMFQAF